MNKSFRELTESVLSGVLTEDYRIEKAIKDRERALVYLRAALDAWKAGDMQTAVRELSAAKSCDGNFMDITGPIETAKYNLSQAAAAGGLSADKVLAGINWEAGEYELYSGSPGLAKANKDIDNAVIKAVGTLIKLIPSLNLKSDTYDGMADSEVQRLGKEIGKLKTSILDPVLAKYRSLGAEDSEPHYHMKNILAKSAVFILRAMKFDVSSGLGQEIGDHIW